MPLNIFKDFRLKWWQGGLFKWSMFALGIAVGSIWHDLFTGLLPLLIAFAALSLGYITYIWWKQ